MTPRPRQIAREMERIPGIREDQAIRNIRDRETILRREAEKRFRR